MLVLVLVLLVLLALHLELVAPVRSVVVYQTLLSRLAHIFVPVPVLALALATAVPNNRSATNR
jgi:hypothetical protein